MPERRMRVRAIPAALWLVLSAAILSHAGDPNPKVIAGAKQEAKVVWWATANIDLSKKMLDAFEKKHPFIETELYRAGRGPMLNRILAEALAGRHVWDVLSGSGEMHRVLADKKLIAPYLSPERVAYEEDMTDPEGNWTAVYVNPYVLGFNTNLVKDQDVPRSYEALLDPKWKGGKISLDSDAYPVLTGLTAAWGREKAVAYLEKLAAQEPIIKRGNTERVQLTAAGEYPLAVAYAPTIEGLIRKGAPLDWVPLEPVVVQINPVELAAKAPHPNAARLFIDFILSKPGQEIIRDSYRVPARADTAAKARRLSSGYKRITVRPDGYGDYEKTVERYQGIFRTR